MNTVYQWLGFLLFWGGLGIVGRYVLLLLATAFGAAWRRLLRQWDWLNYRWYYLVDLLQWYVTRQSRKMGSSADSVRTVVGNFQREPHRSTLKKVAPFRRDFVAMLAKHYRRAR